MAESGIVAKAQLSASMSLSACPALSVTLSRADPRGTVGYRIAGMRKPPSRNFPDISKAVEASPQISG